MFCRSTSNAFLEALERSSQISTDPNLVTPAIRAASGRPLTAVSIQTGYPSAGVFRLTACCLTAVDRFSCSLSEGDERSRTRFSIPSALQRPDSSASASSESTLMARGQAYFFASRHISPYCEDVAACRRGR